MSRGEGYYGKKEGNNLLYHSKVKPSLLNRYLDCLSKSHARLELDMTDGLY